MDNRKDETIKTCRCGAEYRPNICGKNHSECLDCRMRRAEAASRPSGDDCYQRMMRDLGYPSRARRRG